MQAESPIFSRADILDFQQGGHTDFEMDFVKNQYKKSVLKSVCPISWH